MIEVLLYYILVEIDIFFTHRDRDLVLLYTKDIYLRKINYVEPNNTRFVSLR